MSSNGYRVTKTIEGAHPLHESYPLLPGDLLVRTGVQTYAKDAPGLSVDGFVLTSDQEATLEAVKFTNLGLDYWIED